MGSMVFWEVLGNILPAVMDMTHHYSSWGPFVVAGDIGTCSLEALEDSHWTSCDEQDTEETPLLGVVLEWVWLLV